jgi:hypothetical protein
MALGSMLFRFLSSAPTQHHRDVGTIANNRRERVMPISEETQIVSLGDESERKML